MRRGSGWRLAVGTLTVLPISPPETVDRRVAGQAMLVAPLAVLPVAFVAAGLGWVSVLVGWPALLAGLIVIATLGLGTRALHLDGLADTVDGLGSGRDRKWALEIMRRGDVGPMGVVALILVLAAQIVAAATLTGTWPGALLLAVLIAASRGSLLIACRVGVPAARPDGLGATVAASVSPAAAIGSGLLIVGAVVVTGLLAGRPWWALALAVVAAVVVASGIVQLAIRRFGGITGDVLGATVESSLTALVLGVTLG